MATADAKSPPPLSPLSFSLSSGEWSNKTIAYQPQPQIAHTSIQAAIPQIQQECFNLNILNYLQCNGAQFFMQSLGLNREHYCSNHFSFLEATRRVNKDHLTSCSVRLAHWTPVLVSMKFHTGETMSAI